MNCGLRTWYCPERLHLALYSLCRTDSSQFYSTANIYELWGIKTTLRWFTLVCVSEESLPSGSFQDLAMPHFERLFNFACWLTHDRQEAEDLVQETYVKALKGFSS